MLASTNVGATYGLPTRGSVAVSIAGQDIFPVFNNNAYLAPQKCEVDACNEHVGGGGGQPHLHGDPFGTFCLYSALNYTSSLVHPPQIGWSLDGPSIYGRHLSTSNEGYSTALDDCGGHVHTTYTYHYHAQVLTSTVDNGVAPTEKNQIGTTYYASTTGPYKCFKGDISKITNFWGNQATSYTSSSPDTTTDICIGSSQYYQGAGMVLPNTINFPITYSVSQAVLGVNVSTDAKLTTFKTNFIAVIAGLLSIPIAKVQIMTVTTTTRRLGEISQYTGSRPNLRLLAAGVLVRYEVTATASNSATATSRDISNTLSSSEALTSIASAVGNS